MKKKITVYDIAAEAGVSPSTVSRILTGSASVSSQKRENVLRLIEKYDFHPNTLARSLSKNESKNIGFILPDITTSFFSTVFFETEKCALQQGYTIILGNSMGDYNIESTLLNMLMEKQVDVIVFMGGRVNNVRNHPKLAQEMQQVARSTPIVMVNGKMTGLDCYNVRTDETSGLNELLEYLVSIGHKKLGILGGRSGTTSSALKYKALRNFLAKHDLECREEWIIQSGFSMSGGMEAINHLLEQERRPSAVIGINDYVAIGMMRALQAKHIKIPEDVSIAGFDDSYLTVVTNPALTSVSQNYEMIGSAIMDTILNIMAGRYTEKEKLVPTKLIVRNSCGRV